MKYLKNITDNRATNHSSKNHTPCRTASLKCIRKQLVANVRVTLIFLLLQRARDNESRLLQTVCADHRSLWMTYDLCPLCNLHCFALHYTCTSRKSNNTARTNSLFFHCPSLPSTALYTSFFCFLLLIFLHAFLLVLFLLFAFLFLDFYLFTFSCNCSCYS